MLITLILSGCVETVHWQECEVEERVVSDDEPLGDVPFTVSELIAIVEGVHTVPLTAPDGTVHEAEIETLAVGAPATFWDGTIVAMQSEGGRRTLFPSYAVSLSYVECADRVEVPVELRAVTGDGALDVGGEAIASNAGDFVNVSRDLDLAQETLLPSVENLSDATIEAQYDATGLHFVSAWWSQESPRAYEQSLEGPL